MYHTWSDLLFLHWRLDSQVVQQALPEGLFVDSYDGAAWVGIVPFFMRNIRPWWFTTVPGISNFQEINLRTYVYDEQGLPGVWFLTLDSCNGLANWWGRTRYGLPYQRADMSCRRSGNGMLEYETARRGTDPSQASRFVYGPGESLGTAEPGTLEFFLIERYVLFSQPSAGRLATGRVWHPPYQLHSAKLQAWDANLISLYGWPQPEGPPAHAVYSPGVDVHVFAAVSAASTASA